MKYDIEHTEYMEYLIVDPGPCRLCREMRRSAATGRRQLRMDSKVHLVTGICDLPALCYWNGGTHIATDTALTCLGGFCPVFRQQNFEAVAYTTCSATGLSVG